MERYPIGGVTMLNEGSPKVYGYMSSNSMALMRMIGALEHP